VDFCVVAVVVLSVVGGVVLRGVDDVVVLGGIVAVGPVVVVVVLVVRSERDTLVADLAEEPHAASRIANGTTTLAAMSFGPRCLVISAARHLPENASWADRSQHLPRNPRCVSMQSAFDPKPFADPTRKNTFAGSLQKWHAARNPPCGLRRCSERGSGRCEQQDDRGHEDGAAYCDQADAGASEAKVSGNADQKEHCGQEYGGSHIEVGVLTVL
jgi:hypothetical protein